MISQESLSFPICDKQSLHLRLIAKDKQAGPVIFFMHGAVENGKIFYTESNKGLAPYLAEQGYRCYVADLRGRGLSTPSISAESEYGQTESILEDIPCMLDFIESHSGSRPNYWVAHSWGGVLMNSYLARFPNEISNIKACVYFGSKRSLYNWHWSKLLKANLLWYWLAFKYTRKHGYLPARELKWGSDDETKKSHSQSAKWAMRSKWVDSDDEFDYGKALEHLSLPPILHIAGVKDKALAQPVDIKKFMSESGQGTQVLNIYGKEYGHKHNYDHIDMLTHPFAREDQFRDLIEWFQRFA